MPSQKQKQGCYIRTAKHRIRMAEITRKAGPHFHSEETKKKISLANKGKHHKNKGIPHTIEHNNKVAIALMKCRIDGYCDAWGDQEYKNDCRKDYCEIYKAKEEKKTSIYQRKEKTIIKIISNLLLHHKDFNPENCCLNNLQTLCRSCHNKIHFTKRGD